MKLPTHKRTRDGVEILNRRYIQNKPELLQALQDERDRADIAEQIYELRTRRGLSQEALAELVGTTVSVIRRLEGADYAGRSLTTLRRIAAALDAQVRVVFEPKPPAEPPSPPT